MKKLTATLLTFLLILQITPRVSATPKGNWDMVKALVNQSIAVRTVNGSTHFGLLQVADDNAIRIWLADNVRLTQQISLRRDEVAKVWLAKLRMDESNVGKGALIGLGVGFGVGFIAAAILASQCEGCPPHGFALFPMAGAGIGALLGTRWKKKHKKQALVYSI
jgi:hypothetical protein